MSSLFIKVGLHSYAEYERLFEEMVNGDKESGYSIKSTNLPYIKSNWIIFQKVKNSVALIHSLNQLLLNLYCSYTRLVITEPWCTDSAQNLPVLAAMEMLNPKR